MWTIRGRRKCEPDLERAHKNAAGMMEEDKCRKVNMWRKADNNENNLEQY